MSDVSKRDALLLIAFRFYSLRRSADRKFIEGKYTMNYADIHLSMPVESAHGSSLGAGIKVDRADRRKMIRAALSLCEPLLDAVAVIAALAASTLVWGVHSRLSVPLALSLVIVVLSLLERAGIYRPARSLLHVRETAGLLGASTAVTVLLYVLSLLGTNSVAPSRMPMFGLSLFCFLLLAKSGIHALQRKLHRGGITPTPVAIIGAGMGCRRVYSTIVNSPKLGMWPAMVINPLGTKSREETVAESGYRVRQTSVILAEQLNCNKLRNAGVEKLLLVASSFSQDQMQDALQQASACGMETEICTGDVAVANTPMECADIDGIMIWRSLQSGVQIYYQKLKRVFDTTLVVALLIVFSPLMLAVAIAIKLNSPGPIFFRQVRVGKNGRPFTMLKFRSMHQNACGDGFSPKSGNDPRISSIGRLLRKTSLDELPQLINVLKGEMSLVGPRPEMPFIVKDYTALQSRRLEVQPGITGLWQISAHRKDLIHDNMQYDLYYVQHQGIFLDAAILIHTAVFAMKGV
jgi:exopolysaccharide biosynthesis polyprenyl glycosylphosphotransferase